MNGQSGMILKPSRRAVSTAFFASAGPRPRPRSASGSSVWSTMINAGLARE
jgi:hypothetical protein